MILNETYRYKPKAISPQNCHKIIEASKHLKTQKGTIWARREKKELGPRLRPSIRKASISFTNESWVYDLINPFIHEFNKRAGWNFQWDWNEDAQITCYTKGDHYTWHPDQNAHPYLSDHIHLNNKIRKLSLTLQLSDPADYKGGNLEFIWLQKGKPVIERKLELKEQGTIIVFPSFVTHRVTPVTKGKRWSLVNWSVGRTFV